MQHPQQPGYPQQPFNPAQQTSGVAPHQHHQQYQQPGSPAGHHQQQQFQPHQHQHQHQEHQHQHQHQQQPPVPTPEQAAPPAPENTRPDPGEAGLRWTWSAFPNTTRPTPDPADTQAAAIPLPPTVIPLACMYTPLNQGGLNAETGELSDPVPIMPSGKPIYCKNCGAVLNKFSNIDTRSNSWTCRSCLARNVLAAQANDVAAQATTNFVTENAFSSTVEYCTGEFAQPAANTPTGPCFVFVVDTCIPAEELESLKSSLLRSLDLLPHNALVAFITFGRSVTLWELGCEDMNKCYALRGTRKYSTEDLTRMLGVSASTPVVGRFLAPRDEIEFTLSSIMEELLVDPFPVPTGQRPQRATGTAVDLAVTLMKFVNGSISASGIAAPAPAANAGGKFGKVVLFTGGPCTRGPGTITSIDKGEMIRSHRDILDGNVPHFQAATDFYAKLEKELVASHACLDVFAMCLDQVGVKELRGCVNNTGGVMVCGDMFDHKMFTESLIRYLARADLKTEQKNKPLSCGFGAEISVFTSSGTTISGCAGPCKSATPQTSSSGSSAATSLLSNLTGGNKSGASSPTVSSPSSSAALARTVSPLQVGVGGTAKWLVSCLDRHLTLTFVFDTCNKTTNGQQQQQTSGEERFMQFVTKYTAPDGEIRIRVTSVVQPVLPSADVQVMNTSGRFDQACAAAVCARLTVSLMEANETKWETTKRWLDRLLVRFVKKYGTYRINDPDSLRLNSSYSLFPIFLYNLRRSEYFMIINVSPDETTFKRHWLMRETCDLCIRMIQPTLDSYTIEDPNPNPVPLDASAISANNILLMDAFYSIHIVQGKTIHEWEKQGYHNLPDYAHFNHLLEVPQAHAREKLAERFPYPRYSRSDVEHGDARHVKTRLNPSITHNTGQLQGGEKASSEVIYTDDASIARFMQTLKIAVVKPEKK